MGTVLEAKLDRGRGPVATVLVRNGTLRVGDYFIVGSVFGRVRALFDDRGAPTREVLPSMPAEVIGLESLPEVGDSLQVVTDTAKAKQIVIYRESKTREVAMSKNNRITLEQLHDQLKEGEIKELNIILKTDVGGTAEVLSILCRSFPTTRSRSWSCAPESAPSPSPTCCWLRLRTQLSSGSTCVRSELPSPLPSKRRSISGCTRSFMS
jgi:translation initiation factor IF-2